MIESRHSTRNGFEIQTRSLQAPSRRRLRLRPAVRAACVRCVGSADEMAKKEKGATFAQNSDLIEEHLKAAFKAATDANVALREEVNQLKKALAADTERSQSIEQDTRRAQDEQRDLTRRMKEAADLTLRYADDCHPWGTPRAVVTSAMQDC